MLKNKLNEVITQFIKEEIFDDATLVLNPTSNLADFGIQSIEIMELVALIERYYKCKLPTEFVYQKNIKSIASIVSFLENFLGQNAKCST